MPPIANIIVIKLHVNAREHCLLTAWIHCWTSKSEPKWPQASGKSWCLVAMRRKIFICEVQKLDLHISIYSILQHSTILRKKYQGILVQISQLQQLNPNHGLLKYLPFTQPKSWHSWGIFAGMFSAIKLVLIASVEELCSPVCVSRIRIMSAWLEHNRK